MHMESSNAAAAIPRISAAIAAPRVARVESFGGDERDRPERESAPKGYKKAEAEVEWLLRVAQQSLGVRSGGSIGTDGKVPFDEGRSEEKHMSMRRMALLSGDCERYRRVAPLYAGLSPQSRAVLNATYIPHAWEHHANEAFRWGRREVSLIGVSLLTTALRQEFARVEQRDAMAARKRALKPVIPAEPPTLRDLAMARAKARLRLAPGTIGVCSIRGPHELLQFICEQTRPQNPMEAKDIEANPRDRRAYNWPGAFKAVKIEAEQLVMAALAEYDFARTGRDEATALAWTKEVERIRGERSAKMLRVRAGKR